MNYWKSVLLSLTLSLVMFNISCAQQGQVASKPKIESKAFDKTVSGLISESVPLISVDELAKTQDKYIILDAREMSEYKVSHIEKAMYIGYDNWDKSVLESIDKDAKVVVYCSIGVRSEKIGEELQKRGFTDVQNLYGSIFEWANQGHPIVDNAGYPTKKVHAYNWVWGKWMTNDDYEKVYK